MISLSFLFHVVHISTDPFASSQESGAKSKRGWLSKQGGSSKGWKRRWCVFENNALFYYKSDADKEWAGVIYAEDMRTVAVAEEESKKNPKYSFCFELETKERTWMVRSVCASCLN